MQKRTPFVRLFWVANSIEVFERFAYYGIYMGFGIYLEHLGYSMGQLGLIQVIFLFFSYVVPVFSGSLADKYGFKTLLYVSYAAYLPSILLLIATKTFSGIALTMLCIGLAAGIFKPLVSATIRSVTDRTNKTLGFGIFYAMVNVGGSFGPLVAGKLRAISWDLAFYVSAGYIVVMFLITLFFYKEPPRDIGGVRLGEKLKLILSTLANGKFLVFLILLGFFFWLPLWSFFNIIALYVDKCLDTHQLYLAIQSVLGTGVADFLSPNDAGYYSINCQQFNLSLYYPGTKKILGETIAHTGYIIILFQVLVSFLFEKLKAMKAFSIGLLVGALGFVTLGLARLLHPAWVFLGIFLFAVGEMASSPRIQEYITWIAPKEKAGLYMGSNFLAISLGTLLSGLYTMLFGHFRGIGHPEYIWFALALHMLLGIGAFAFFSARAGEFKELDS